MSHGEAGMKPVGGAVLVLHPLTQAGSRGANVLAGSFTSEDSLIQTAGGQNVFLIHPTEGQTVGTEVRLSTNKTFLSVPESKRKEKTTKIFEQTLTDCLQSSWDPESRSVRPLFL